VKIEKRISISGEARMVPMRIRQIPKAMMIKGTISTLRVEFLVGQLNINLSEAQNRPNIRIMTMANTTGIFTSFSFRKPHILGYERTETIWLVYYYRKIK
jgi:hypothetical protein